MQQKLTWAQDISHVLSELSCTFKRKFDSLTQLFLGIYQRQPHCRSTSLRVSFTKHIHQMAPFSVYWLFDKDRESLPGLKAQLRLAPASTALTLPSPRPSPLLSPLKVENRRYHPLLLLNRLCPLLPQGLCICYSH